MYEHIQIEATIFHILQICATRGKNVYEVYEVTSLLLEIFPFPCSLV